MTDNQRLNILNYLEGIPADWQLLPVSGKRGYLPGWQNGIDRETIKDELINGKATGIGVILGELSGGLVAVDEDGEQAMITAQQLSNGINPSTYEFTSGRENRRQRIYRIPEEYREFVQTRRLSCGLEFRYNGCQSVLPFSLHPITHAPYIEVVSHNIAEAPLWVISAMMRPETTRPLASPENAKFTDTFWHSQLVQFPARIYSYYGPCLKIWLLAKWYDQEGKGHHKIGIYAAATALRRKQSTIKTWLNEAKQKGLIRYYTYTSDGYIKIYYSALWKVVVNTGMTDLGPVARINLCDINNLSITATQVEKQHRQRQSEFTARKVESDRLISLGKSPEEAKALSRTIKADTLLSHPCENLERVLCQNNSTIFVSEGFLTYGANNENIAHTMGIHPVTVSRHLSNSYRTPSPVKGYKAESYLLEKKQVLQRCPRNFKNIQGDRQYWQGKGKDSREWERKPSIIQEQFTFAKSRKARKIVSEVTKTVTEVTELLVKTTILKAFSPFCVCVVGKKEI